MTVHDVAGTVTVQARDGSAAAVTVYEVGAPYRDDAGLAGTVTVAEATPGTAVGVRGMSGGAGAVSGVPPPGLMTVMVLLLKSAVTKQTRGGRSSSLAAGTSAG